MRPMMEGLEGRQLFVGTALAFGLAAQLLWGAGAVAASAVVAARPTRPKLAATAADAE